MLETEIKNLNETISRLIKELESLVPIVAELSKPESTPAPTSAPTSEPKTKTKTKTKSKVKTSRTETPTTETSIAKTKDKVEDDTSTGAVTDKDLMDLCLAIVRKDRTKKAKIKEIISSFGGDLISEIDPARYPELEKELEALL